MPLTDYPLGVLFYGQDRIGSHRYAMRTRDGWIGADYRPVDMVRVEREANLEEEQGFNALLVENAPKAVA